jgi:hypothetical protein
MLLFADSPFKPQQFKVKGSTETTLSFKWERPKIGLGITQYIFDILCEDEPVKTKKLRKNDHEFTAKNLVEGKAYDFKLAAEYNGVLGPYVKCKCDLKLFVLVLILHLVFIYNDL